MENLISPAKINLRLKITGKRSDTGYHTLSMINATASLVDEITIHAVTNGAPSVRQVSFGDTIPESQKAELERVLKSDSNSAIKAAVLFGQKFSVPVGIEFSITKRIPAGAGLGGGSSNAASILVFLLKKYLNDLLVKYGDGLTQEVLTLALSLGADVPYLLCGGGALVRGIGEEVEPLSTIVQTTLHEMDIIIALPAEPSVTKEAYAAFSKANPWLEVEARQDESSGMIQRASSEVELLKCLSALLENDFEEVVSAKLKSVDRILKLTKSLDIGRVVLSGSGSSVLILPLPSRKFTLEQKSAIKKALFSASINHFDGSIYLY